MELFSAWCSNTLTPLFYTWTPSVRPLVVLRFAAGHSQEIHPALLWISLLSGHILFVCSKGTSFFPFCVFIFFFDLLIMVVPYANRAAVASLPTLALASKPTTVKEVIEDFAKQVPLERALECVQLIKGRTIRVVFPSARMMEEMVHTGLTFRNHPIEFKMPSVFHWVTLLDLPYGIPEDEIRTALSKFGQIAHVNSESYMGLYTGTRLVKIELRAAIPSRVIVAGHVCTTFYKGQVRSCFKCGLTGHEAKKCPGRQRAPPGENVPGNEESVPQPEPFAQDEPSPGQGARMATTPRKVLERSRRLLLLPLGVMVKFTCLP